MESTPEEAAEGLAIVRVLAAVLDRLVCANSPLARTEPGQITKFHALKAPGIGIQQYLERIHKYACCSSQCFIMALIYIDRLIQRNNFLLTELNVHRVIVTAILLAAKFFDDAYYNNAYYAKVGGVLISEMNGLEVDFLFRINFSLHVTPELFEQYRNELLSHSGTGSLPMPPTLPPQQQQQQHPVPMLQAPSPYTNTMQHEVLQVQVPLPHEQLQHSQQLQAMASYVPSQHVSAVQQITPSPTRALPFSTGADSASSMVGTTNDQMMVSADGTAMANAILPTGKAGGHLYPDEFVGGYLQRANSLPAQNIVNKSQMTNNQQHQNNPVRTQPLSAPTMISVVPGNEQFVVLDSQVYQLPGPGTGMLAPLHHHQNAAKANLPTTASTLDPASGLIHHVHHPSAAVAATTGHVGAGVSGFVSREAAVASQRFAAVTGQMVAGVSGGL